MQGARGGGWRWQTDSKWSEDTRIWSTSLIRCHARSPPCERLLISARTSILWRCISAHGPELLHTSFLFYSESKQLALPCRYHRHTLSPSLFLSGHSPEERAAKFYSPSAPFFRAYAARRQRCVAPLSLIKSGRRYFTLKKYNKIDKWAKLILGMKLAGRVRGLLEMMNEVELPYIGARPLG